MSRATAKSYSNIAFIKYWGNRDDELRIPVNGSISMNLEGIETVTSVAFDEAFEEDRLLVNGNELAGPALSRVTKHLDHIRSMAGSSSCAKVESTNNFPMGAGIASSASAFSALTIAACGVLRLDLSEAELTRIARLGSGSASRSVPGGFVEWYAGTNHESSYAASIAPPQHWDLVDLVAVVSSEHKAVGSTGGHKLAHTSPLQNARIEDTQRRLDICRHAILERDFEEFADVVEQDAVIMHGVMMTSVPPLYYWVPATLSVMDAVRTLRQSGTLCCFTIDAGPNVHVITTEKYETAVMGHLEALEGVQNIIVGRPGGPARLLETS